MKSMEIQTQQWRGNVETKEKAIDKNIVSVFKQHKASSKDIASNLVKQERIWKAEQLRKGLIYNRSTEQYSQYLVQHGRLSFEIELRWVNPMCVWFMFMTKSEFWRLRRGASLEMYYAWCLLSLNTAEVMPSWGFVAFLNAQVCYTPWHTEDMTGRNCGKSSWQEKTTLPNWHLPQNTYQKAYTFY